jgi:hypothetical protein
LQMYVGIYSSATVCVYYTMIYGGILVVFCSLSFVVVAGPGPQHQLPLTMNTEENKK